MEAVPPDKSHEPLLQLEAVQSYHRKCTEANGEIGAVMIAAMELLVKQFSFDFEEAQKIVHNSRIFNSNDSDIVIHEKAAFAPLLLVDSYVSGVVSDKVILADTKQQRDEAYQASQQIETWYSGMTGLAIGMSSERHSMESCCADNILLSHVDCMGADACPLRVVGGLLLEPALQAQDAVFFDGDDAAKWYVVVSAKLRVACENGFIGDGLWAELDNACRRRVEVYGGGDNS